MVVALVPMLLDGVLRNGKGKWEDAELAAAAQQFRQSPRDRYRQVGPLDHACGSQRVRDGRRHAASDALPREFLIYIQMARHWY